ncbi:MAG: leucine-rich repeat protein [Lachnospiraceae bacterium]|nr:leucine-rich repeat protein [Lachnospiraceae bacterium]
MREEKDSITIFEDEYNSESRYSKDFKHAYSIPEDCGCYRLHDGCMSLELKGRESMCYELILPQSFITFYVESMLCLPYLRKITAYSQFLFWGEDDSAGYNVLDYLRNSRLEEICVLPWLVDWYKQRLGYWEGVRDAIVKVSPLSDSFAQQFTISNGNGLITSKDGKTLVKVDKKIKVLEIPVEVERIAATAFDSDNVIEKLVLLGNSEDNNKDRNWSLFEFNKEAINSLKRVETLVFQGPMYTSFYDDATEGAQIPNLKTVIFPLWNRNHYCFRGKEAESSSIHNYEVKAENFSSVELVEEEGIVYTKDGKFLVSGVDCKSKFIRIKDGVEEIFKYAFCCNIAIEEVYIPRSVTKVGANAFKSCVNIKKIIFNFNQVAAGVEHAFFTYSKNLHLYLSDSPLLSDKIRHQYENLHNKFRNMGLGALTEKHVIDNPKNVVIHTLPYYPGEVIIDEDTGMVYDETGKTFVGVLKEQAKKITNFSLPKHIKDIFESAFSNLSAVETIEVPCGFNMMHVYKLAQNCLKLKTIIAGEEQLLIENGIVYSKGFKDVIAVSKCTKISDFICKEGVETIGPSAFEGHKELVNVQLPHTIKTIGNRAFANTSLTDISFPASLQELGKEVFCSCSLSAVKFDGHAPEGSSAFNGVNFISSARIMVQKEYKDEFTRLYPTLKHLIKTPLPKWLSWLG